MTVGTLFLWVFAILEGAITASFICLVAARLPRLLREAKGRADARAHVLRGVGMGRSHCDHCHALVRMRDLTPIFAWLALRGRCRDCGTYFGSRELFMELAGAGIGLASVMLFGFSLAALACFAGLSVLFAALAIAQSLQAARASTLSSPSPTGSASR